MCLAKYKFVFYEKRLNREIYLLLIKTIPLLLFFEGGGSEKNMDFIQTTLVRFNSLSSLYNWHFLKMYSIQLC